MPNLSTGGPSGPYYWQMDPTPEAHNLCNWSPLLVGSWGPACASRIQWMSNCTGWFGAGDGTDIEDDCLTTLLLRAIPVMALVRPIPGAGRNDDEGENGNWGYEHQALAR